MTEPYRVFISYSRRASAPLAASLQVAVERFAKPWHRQRSCRVFRDDGNLSANSALWDSIEQALKEAEWLVLLASPEAANSAYVDRELSWWVANKDPGQVLIVLASGQLRWNDAGCEFDLSSTAMPPAIARSFAQEPRWVDLTWFAADGSLGPDDPRFIERVADIAAAVRGVDRDELVGESIRQHKRTKALAKGAVTGLSLLLATSMLAGGVAVTNRAEAVQQRDTAQQEATVATARLLAAQAVAVAGSDLQQGLQLAAAGYQLNPDSFTEKALFDVNSESGSLVKYYDAGSNVTATAGSSDGDVLLAGTSDGRVLRWDSKGAKQEIIAFGAGAIKFLAITEDGKTIVATSEVTQPDGDGGEEVVSRNSASWTAGVASNLPFPVDAMSPTGKTLVSLKPAATFGDPTLVVVHAAGLEQTYSVGDGSEGLIVPDDDTLLNMDIYAQGVKISLADGKRTDFQAGFGLWMFGGAFSPDGTHYAWTNGGKDLLRMSVAKGRPMDDDLVLPSGNGRPSSIALTRGGRRIATTVDGRIFIGEAQDAEGVRVPPIELTGAGPATLGTTRFLGDDLVVSSTGRSLALWDLSQESRISESISAQAPNTCSACGPPQVAVSPSAQVVVALSAEMGGDELTVADFGSGTSRIIEQLEPADPRTGDDMELDAVGWLDGDRLAAYSASQDVLWVLSGALLGTIDSRIELGLDRAESASMGVRPDGTLVVGVGQTLALVDPGVGVLQTRSYSGGKVSEDGLRATLLEQSDVAADNIQGDAGQTHVLVEDLSTGALLVDREVPGEITDAVLTGEAELAVWRRDASSSGQDKMVKIKLDDGTELESAVGASPAYNRTLHEGGSWAAEEALGVVTFTDIQLGAAFPIAQVETEVRRWTAFDFADDGSQLVLSNSPAGTMTRIISGPSQWLDLACRTVDHQPIPDSVWMSLTAMPLSDRPTCTGSETVQGSGVTAGSSLSPSQEANLVSEASDTKLCAAKSPPDGGSIAPDGYELGADFQALCSALAAGDFDAIAGLCQGRGVEGCHLDDFLQDPRFRDPQYLAKVTTALSLGYFGADIWCYPFTAGFGLSFETGPELTFAGQVLGFQVPERIPDGWHPDYEGPVIEFAYEMSTSTYRFAGMRHSTAADWIEEPSVSYSPCSPKRSLP